MLNLRWVVLNLSRDSAEPQVCSAEPQVGSAEPQSPTTPTGNAHASYLDQLFFSPIFFRTFRAAIFFFGYFSAKSNIFLNPFHHFVFYFFLIAFGNP